MNHMTDTDSWIAFWIMDILMDTMTDNMMDQMMDCAIIFHHINGHVILYFTDFSTVHKSGARM